MSFFSRLFGHIPRDGSSREPVRPDRDTDDPGGGRLTPRMLAAWSVGLLSPSADDRVVEIHPGDGGGAAVMLESVTGVRITGIEPNRAAAKRTERLLGKKFGAGSISIAAGELTELPFEDGAFSRALAVNSLPAWPDPVPCLKELHRVLEPGAVGVFTVLPRWLDTEEEFEQLGLDLSAWLTEAGFTVSAIVRRAAKPRNAVGLVALKPR
jgi:SAM-dependent methyltransferase